MIAGMNVLITGAAGFLGSHLAAHYVENGHYVIGVDNFCSSSPGSRHLAALKANQRFSFKQLDITKMSTYAGGTFDLVLNFACPASPPIYQKMPIETMMTCTLGTMNVLELARQHKAVVVHASTSEVYGDPIVSPQVEAHKGNVNSYGPRACYDEGKRAAEALCYDYLHNHSVDVRLVRIFNTYGPQMDQNDGRVVSNFICQALRGKPLTVYGDGRQTRSLCYVDDLVRGIVRLGELATNPMTPVNLGNPNEVTVSYVASKVLKQVYGDSILPRFGAGDPNTVTFKQLPIDDPTQRKPDITLAKQLLGWEPTVDLSVGLEKTIRYFQGVL